MNESIIQVQKLSHRYTSQWAIRDISFEINQPGVYGLLGSNGAGKSTTMNILCGIMRPSEGSVTIDGIDLLAHPEEAKCHIGYLPQKPPLYMELTVGEYLDHCARLHYLSHKEARKAVDEVLGICSIAHFKKRLLKSLSGGYQQRVGIAQAIIHNPDFIVLDEPTNGLDPNQILDIRRLIKQLGQEHVVLFSSHILSEVQAACDHVQMIEKGKKVFEGTIYEFDNYIRPSSLFVSLAAAPEVEELKSNIPELLSAEKLDKTAYRLHFSDVQEAVERVVEISYSHQWQLEEIYVERNALDLVFAELSKK